MGKPHCNSSVLTFECCTYGMSITVSHASGSECSAFLP